MKTTLSIGTLCIAVFVSCLAPTGRSAIAATSDIEVGFSPNGTAEALVLKSIDAAHRSVRLMAYSFTAPAVVRALIAAKRRGVDVGVIVDFKNNITDDRSGKGRAALNLLANAGISTRTIAVFPIQHSKYVVIDDLHVETGSYNFSAAARYNSENVLVLWNRPEIAKSYSENWKSLYSQSEIYSSSY